MGVDGLAEIAEPHEEENLSQELINMLTQDFNKYLRTYNNRFLRVASATPADEQNTRAALDAASSTTTSPSTSSARRARSRANIQVALAGSKASHQELQAGDPREDETWDE